MSIESVRLRLQEAIGTGELIGIIYSGGSRPGAHREIIPLQIDGDRVRARCYASNAVKVFMLHKIELKAEPDKSSTRWQPQPLQYEFGTIGSAFETFRTKLEDLGWETKLSSEGGAEKLSLFSRYKNGNIRKYPDIAIEFEAWGQGWAITPEGSDTSYVLETYRRERPWVVGGPRQSSSFEHLNNAVGKFMTYAIEFAPGKKSAKTET